MCLRGQPIPMIVMKCYHFQSNEHVFVSVSVKHRYDPLSGSTRKKMLDVSSQVVNFGFLFRLLVFALIKKIQKDYALLFLDNPMFVSPSCRSYRTKNQKQLGHNWTGFSNVKSFFKFDNGLKCLKDQSHIFIKSAHNN